MLIPCESQISKFATEFLHYFLAKLARGLLNIYGGLSMHSHKFSCGIGGRGGRINPHMIVF